MQQRYVGDVGDFGKYGLLRGLLRAARPRRPRLAMLWWLTADESHNADGRHAAYLDAPAEYRACDEALFDAMRAVRAARTVQAVMSAGLLPPDAVSFDEPLTFSARRRATERRSARDGWLERARAASRDAQLLFFDPDNGLECRSVGRHALKGPKYVFEDELQALGGPAQSLLVYHHLSRTSAHRHQVSGLLERLRRALPKHAEPIAFHFRRGTPRVFALVPSRRHPWWQAARAGAALDDAWRPHFGLGSR